MIAGLKIMYLWHDNDVIEVRVTVQNEDFRGTADVYVEPGGLLEAATLLASFPTNHLDKREIRFGAAGNGFAGGFVRLEFYCEDGAGHAAFFATIEGHFRHRELPESATIRVSFEPAALDAFLLELRQVEKERSGSASLITAP